MIDDRHDALTRREFLARSAAVAGAVVGTSAAGSLSALLKPLAVRAAPARVATRPLVFVVRTEALTLDPHQNDFVYSQNAQRPVYEPLVDYVPDGKGGARIAPVLATEWRASSDARVYTFRLRSGVRFSDGTPFDAEAVKWNFDRLKAVNKGPAARLPTIERVDVVDRLTVRVTLKTPFAPFIEALAKAPYMVSPAAQAREQAGDLAQRWLNDHAVGTGPYLLESWVRGQQVTFVRNPTYWRGWQGPHAERVIVRLVRESATQRLMLETGEADLADGITITDAEALKKNPTVVIEEHDTPAQIHIMMRMRGPFTDPRFRQAMRAVFGYSSFVGGVLLNKGRIPNGPIARGIWAHDPSLPQFRRELTRAKQLIQEVGPAQKTFVLQTISPFFPYYPQLAQIFQQNLAEVGINLSIDDKPDAAGFLGALASLDRGPDMYGWAINPAYDDPHDILFRTYHSTSTPPTAQNFTFYRNPQVDELIDRGVAVPDRERRRPFYNQVQRVLRDDGPAIFCAQFFQIFGRSKKLHGFEWHPFLFNLPPDFYALWVEE
ncbi:MAG: ABC transporter substrate-binding protein [Armatimonadota bacterium]|nr:ABC transporter substrate-binding protein [Armatimonadota bacterium]